MPIPIILAGLGVAAGVIGAGGHISAKQTNERAQKVMEDAQNLYSNAKYSLEKEKKKTEEALVRLGHSKKYVLDTSMKQFLDSFEKIKKVKVKEWTGINEKSKFIIDEKKVMQIREMTNIYEAAFASSTTGAVTGAAIALATSGTLSIVTGELALASSAVMAGEIGAAAGFAGSALSVGASMTPLVAVAAPVVLFTGISASIKADENLEKAMTTYAEAEAASEKMKVSKMLCRAISEKTEMFENLLMSLNKIFAESSGILAGLVKKKEGMVFKKKLSGEDFTEEELKLIHLTWTLADTIKQVIETPILTKEGEISHEAEQSYKNIVEKGAMIEKELYKLKMNNYNVRPIPVKMNRISLGLTEGSTKFKVETLFHCTRNVIAIILGFFAAITFTDGIASIVTKESSKFLFITSLQVNSIAIWLLLCTTVTMIFGKFRNTKVEEICVWGSGYSLAMLFVQYCRIVEQMDHYIIFSIIFLVVLFFLYRFFEDNEDEWNFAIFAITQIYTMALWPLGFFAYLFLSNIFSFSNDFFLIVISLIMYIKTIPTIQDKL